MHPRSILILVCAVLLGGPLASAQDPDSANAERRIEQVLLDQAKAWNRGDLEAFMAGYDRSPALRFASAGTVTYGWQSTLERYKQRYPDRAAMGELTFGELATTVLAPDAAVVFGRWRLHTAGGEPHGLFTLVFRQIGGEWRIVADHTSAAEAGH